MLLATVGDTGYNIILFFHILFGIIGLAPLFVDPVVAMKWADNDGALRQFSGVMANANQKLFGNALILAGLLGFGVAGMSDKVYSVSDPWLIVAVIVWIAMIGVLHGMLIPAAKAYAAGDAAAPEKKLQTFGPVLPVLTLVMLFLMVFKPGA